MAKEPWWSAAAAVERLSGVPARFSLPIVQAAQGGLIGVIGLYWDARSDGGDAYLTAPHLLMIYGFEAAVVTAALLHGVLPGPRAAGERARRVPRVLTVVESLVVAGLGRALAPRRRPQAAAPLPRGARVVLWAGALGPAGLPLHPPPRVG